MQADLQLTAHLTLTMSLEHIVPEKELVLIQEGLTKAYVPNIEKYKVGNKIEPAHAPVFYNPAMTLCRTFSIIVTEAYRRYFDLDELTVCEPLAGTGIRGLRYLFEVKNVKKVIMNDIDERAFYLMKKNVELHGVHDLVELYRMDASAMMLQLRQKYAVHVIDIDPFGSPIPFIHAALRLVRHGGLLSVTATDVGVLMGRHPQKCIRRYGSRPVQSKPFSREAGLRILIGTIARIALEFDYGVKPLIAYYEGHYYRAFLLVGKDRADAKETIENLGYLIFDRETEERVLVKSYPLPPSSVKGEIYGPLWAGPLVDLDFIKFVRDVYREYTYAHSAKLNKLIESLYDEAPLSTRVYYTSSEVCRKLGSEVSASRIIDMLNSMGIDASRTHFDSRGFRTTASIEETRRIIKLALS